MKARNRNRRNEQLFPSSATCVVWEVTLSDLLHVIYHAQLSVDEHIKIRQQII